MLFALLCKDKPDHLQVRLDNRPDHVVFLRKLNEAGTLKIRRPIPRRRRQADGQPCRRSRRPTRPRPRRLAPQDPYAKAGLFESVKIRAWNWTFNNPANPSNP